MAACSTAAACLIALLAPTPGLYLFVFIGSSLASGLAGISRLSIVAELSSEGERPTYVALTNMVTAPFVLFGLLGGWLADRFGYNIVFVLAGILALASALWLAAKVEEPRFRDRSIIQPAQFEA